MSGFTEAQIEEMRRAVANGTGHECSEWWGGGRCLLCGLPRPFKCPECGRESYNENDIANQYCGACHLFFA